MICPKCRGVNCVCKRNKDNLVSLIINGHLPSLKNQVKLARSRKSGKPYTYKSKELEEYEKNFFLQVPAKARIKYPGPVSLKVRVWYRSKKSDLNIEYLKDLLQKTEIILNDRQIMHEENWKGCSQENPRVVFSLYPWEEA